jgi:hypothetical protein
MFIFVLFLFNKADKINPVITANSIILFSCSEHQSYHYHTILSSIDAIRDKSSSLLACS